MAFLSNPNSYPVYFCWYWRHYRKKCIWCTCVSHHACKSTRAQEVMSYWMQLQLINWSFFIFYFFIFYLYVYVSFYLRFTASSPMYYRLIIIVQGFWCICTYIMKYNKYCSFLLLCICRPINNYFNDILKFSGIESKWSKCVFVYSIYGLVWNTSRIVSDACFLVAF